jgi:hypothetical protein
MNWQPVVVIATHQRVKITTDLINNVIESHHNVRIVCVVSSLDEFNHFKNLNNDRLAIAIWPNKPLGVKWQQGINIAKKIGADPVIILGSDDQLNPEFIDNALKLLDKGYDFIGLRQYRVKHNGTLYTFNYRPIMPIGGGRVYTAKMLKAFNWKLFEPKDKHLDDFGWKQVTKSKMKAILITDAEYNGLLVTANKGNWVMLNPFNPKHPNLQLVNRVSCAE